MEGDDAVDGRALTHGTETLGRVTSPREKIFIPEFDCVILYRHHSSQSRFNLDAFTHRCSCLEERERARNARTATWPPGWPDATNPGWSLHFSRIRYG